MVWGFSGGRERDIGAKITARPRLQPDLGIRETQTQFPSYRHRKAFKHQLWLLFNKEYLCKQAAKQNIAISAFFLFSAAQETISFDSCSTCRCWHCLNKYLHIAHMYPFTSRSINIYSWVKCKLLQSSTSSNNGVITAQMGRLLCIVLYQASLVQSSGEQNMSQHSLFILSFLTIVILVASWNTHIDCVDSCLGKRNWKVDAIIDLQALITCNWPYIDPSYSAKLMTVLITICYWFLSPSYNTYAQSWTCTVHNHVF